MEAIGVVIVIGLILLLVRALKGKTGVNSNLQAPTSSPSNRKNEKIDRNFSSVAIHFFNGYLSLCKAHRVTGHAYVQEIANENNLDKLEFLIGCKIFTVDDEDASDKFDVVRRVIAIEQNEISLQVSDILDRIRKQEEARDNQMKVFFHCDDLFYPFCEIDEYEFNDPDITIQCKNFCIYPRFGFRKDETLKFVRSELLQMWPEAKIDVGKYGMMVQVNSKADILQNYNIIPHKPNRECRKRCGTPVRFGIHFRTESRKANSRSMFPGRRKSG